MKAIRLNQLLGVIGFVTVTVWGGVAAAATLILGASAQSRYDAFGVDLLAVDPSQSLPISNTLTGFRAGIEHRSYFVFNVSAIAQPVISAKLRLLNKRYYSTANSETIELFDVKPENRTQLVGGFQRRDIFDDLGEGAAYGTATLTATPPQTDFDNLVEDYFEVTLTAAAIADINQAAATSDGVFSMGVKLAAEEVQSPYTFTCKDAAGQPIPGCTLTGLQVEGVVFSGGARDGRKISEVPGELILELEASPPYTGVPESSTVLSLLGLGLSGIILKSMPRRR